MKMQSMEHKLLFITGVLCITGLTVGFIAKYSTGIAGRTGSPGETICSACHGGGSGTTVVNISATPSFSANKYIPGNTYTITVSVINNAYNLFGFGCEVLNASNNTDAGNMTTALSGVQFLVAANGRKNATHTSPKSGTGTASFQFVWTAPTTPDTVTIYAAGNAVNGNGSTLGDMANSASLTITPDVTGISNAEIKNTMTVYPNPASGFININIQYFNQPQDVFIELFDIKGNKVCNLSDTRINYGENHYRVLLPDNISNGIYFVKVKTLKESILSKMLIVQK